MRTMRSMAVLGLWLAACQPPPGSTPPPRDPRALADSAYRVEWGALEVPELRAGQPAVLRVEVRNVGDARWPDSTVARPAGAFAVRLCHRFRPKDGPAPRFEPPRVDLPAPLDPGGRLTLQVPVTAPQAGEWVLELGLVQEMVAWFDEKGAATLQRPVVVRPARP